MKKTWVRRLLVVLALALPATAYAATKLHSSCSESCPLGEHCPFCHHGHR